MRDDFHADVAAGAGSVLDHHRLPGELRQALSEQARQQIDRAAGRERRDDPDRLDRKLLRIGRAAGQRQQPGEQQR